MVQTAFVADVSIENTASEIDSNLKNPSVWNDLGNCLLKVGALTDAIDAIKNAIDGDPGFGLSYSNLAVICTRQGKFTEAVMLCKKSIKLLSDKKEKALTWTRLAEAYRQLGQYEQAMSAYREADKLNEVRSAQRREFTLLDPAQIHPNPRSTRAHSDITDLTASIRIHGIIQPLIVCPEPGDPGEYILIAGSRRLAAAKKLGLREIPALVRQANAQEILELSIIENDCQLETNLMERAENYQLLVKEFNLSVDELSERLSTSPYEITHCLSLLDLPDDLKQACGENQITQEQAEALNQLATSQSRQLALQYVIKNDLNTGQIEDLIFRINKPNISATKSQTQDEPESVDITESPVLQADEEHRPENTSLVSRARFLLKSNPKGERRWSTPAYRA